MFDRDIVGEAVTVVERGWVNALAPSGIGRSNAVRRGRHHWHNREAETGDQRFNLLTDIAPLSDDQGFSDSFGGNNQLLG